MITINVLLYCFISSTYALQEGHLLSSGPFTTTLLRLEKCDKPTIPYDKNPSFLYSSESYNSRGKKLMRANLTVVKISRNIKSKIRAFIKEGDQWKIMYMNRGVGCQAFIMSALKIIFKINAPASCIPKGSYTNKDLSFNDLQHRWMKRFMYGRFLWILEIVTKAGTNVCWQYETDITPNPE